MAIVLVSKRFLLYHVKSDGVAKSEEELAFLQYFEVTPLLHKIDREQHCLSLREETKNKVDQSINFNSKHIGLVVAGLLYELFSCFFIVSVYHTVR